MAQVLLPILIFLAVVICACCICGVIILCCVTQGMRGFRYTRLGSSAEAYAYGALSTTAGAYGVRLPQRGKSSAKMSGYGEYEEISSRDQEKWY